MGTLAARPKKRASTVGGWSDGKGRAVRMPSRTVPSAPPRSQNVTAPGWTGAWRPSASTSHADSAAASPGATRTGEGLTRRATGRPMTSTGSAAAATGPRGAEPAASATGSGSVGSPGRGWRYRHSPAPSMRTATMRPWPGRIPTKVPGSWKKPRSGGSTAHSSPSGCAGGKASMRVGTPAAATSPPVPSRYPSIQGGADEGPSTGFSTKGPAPPGGGW